MTHKALFHSTRKVLWNPGFNFLTSDSRIRKNSDP